MMEVRWKRDMSLVVFVSAFVAHSSLTHFCLTDTTMNDAMAGAIPQETTGIPAQGLQAVPVYQGLKPKKPVIEEGTPSIVVSSVEKEYLSQNC